MGEGEGSPLGGATMMKGDEERTLPGSSPFLGRSRVHRIRRTGAHVVGQVWSPRCEPTGPMFVSPQK